MMLLNYKNFNFMFIDLCKELADSMVMEMLEDLQKQRI